MGTFVVLFGAQDILVIVASLGSLAGTLLLLQALAKYLSTELAVTDKRIIAKFGLVRLKTWQMSHNRVESITVNQGIPGRIFNFGTISIYGTGAGMSPIPKVHDPLGFKRAQNEAMDLYFQEQ